MTRTLITPSPGLGLEAERNVAKGSESEKLITAAEANVGAPSSAETSAKVINFIVFSVPQQKPTSSVYKGAAALHVAAHKFVLGASL